MRRRMLSLALMAVTAPALADDQAPPAPGIPTPGGYTPRVPETNPSGGLGGITEERLAEMIDRSVDRAVRNALPALPPPYQNSTSASPQAAIAQATPQGAYSLAVPVSYAAAAPAQQINVLVPPGPVHRLCARMGEHMIQKGNPKLRTMKLAPTTTTPTYTISPAATVTSYTPTVVAPAAAIVASPQR